MFRTASESEWEEMTDLGRENGLPHALISSCDSLALLETVSSVWGLVDSK